MKQRNYIIFSGLCIGVFIILFLVYFYPFYIIVDGNGDDGDDSTSPPTPPLVPDPEIEIPETPILEPIVPNPNSDGEIYLQWDSVEYAWYYEIYRSNNNETYEIIKTDYSYNFYYDSIFSDGTYSYKIIAYNDFGDSPFSNVETVVVDILANGNGEEDNGDNDEIPSIPPSIPPNYTVIIWISVLLIVGVIALFIIRRKTHKSKD